MTPHLMGALPQGRGRWGPSAPCRWGPRAVGPDGRPWCSQVPLGPCGRGGSP